MSALKTRSLLLFCLLAGAMDTLSGLLLMTVPGWTLKLMHVPAVVPDALVFIRFIGAFVFAVGSLYWLGLCSVVVLSRWQGLRGILLVTAWLRTIIFIFTSLALLTGALPLAWLSVPLTDGGLAFFQFWVVLKGRLPRS